MQIPPLPSFMEIIQFIATAKVSLVLIRVRMSTVVIALTFLVIFYGMGWDKTMKTDSNPARKGGGL